MATSLIAEQGVLLAATNTNSSLYIHFAKYQEIYKNLIKDDKA
jgi:hypothetical protein